MKKHKPIISCVSHLTMMLTPKLARFTVKQVIKMINARNLEFDAIACRGLSSMLIAPIVAMRLNKTLICIRKDEKCHSSRVIEGDHGANRYLLLDDFIDSGATIRAIASAIYAVNPEAQCVGFIAYKRLTYPGSLGFKEDMERAWWDEASDPYQRFFPEKYVARHGTKYKAKEIA